MTTARSTGILDPMLSINGILGGGGVQYDATAAFPNVSAIDQSLRTLAQQQLAPIAPLINASSGVTAPLPLPPTTPPDPITASTTAGASRRGMDKAYYSQPESGRSYATNLPTAMAAVGYIKAKDKDGLWMLARPRAGGAGVGVASLSGACLVGSCGLGESPYEKIPPLPAAVAVATEVTKKDFETQTGTRPWYKKPSVWAMIGGGAAVLGGGYWLVRR